MSHLYAAATDRSQWQVFCDELNKITSAPVMMFGHDTTANQSIGSLSAGVDPSNLGIHDQHFAGKNPWMHMNMAMNAGIVGLSDQALPRDELFKTEYYNDWLRHQEDIAGGAALMCYRSSNRYVLLAASCRRKGYEKSLPEAQSLLEAMAPHTLRAIGIASVLSSGGKASYSHLGASRHAIITLKQSGRVEYVNQAAQNFLSLSNGLKIDPSERLVSTHERIRSYLSRVKSAISENSFHALPAPLVIDCKTFGSCTLHCHLFPQDADHGFPDVAWNDPTTGCLVITGQFGLNNHDEFSKIAASFGATPSEAKLAEALLRGTSLKDYCEERKLSHHTVRNQLRMLFLKTGTNSQTEFIRKLMLCASPFYTDLN